ncbi:hypothetical protein [Streptomyces sp. ODS28]|uniref:hypothetical protein n=1 Tax=Streptomyces sp. ODS28 TaxID=3136688 RepID=UPI0031EF685C
MTTTGTGTAWLAAHPGTAWLAHCSPSPTTTHTTWTRGELAPIPGGRTWAVAELGTLTSIELMRSLPDEAALGPVLSHAESDRAWWLVTQHGSDELARVAPWAAVEVQNPLYCPPANLPLHGRGWLEKPDGTGTLTDAHRLAAALQQHLAYAG